MTSIVLPHFSLHLAGDAGETHMTDPDPAQATVFVTLTKFAGLAVPTDL